MKKIGVILSIIIIALMVVFGTTYKEVNKEYLRIHIRANSNAEIDQLVKYKIKDEIVVTITPYIADCTNSVLVKNGFNYTAKSKLCNEEFPTRTYNGYTLESGFYDALIVELGLAQGDNWWCVVYPPLCFTNACNGSNVVYKSRILELIRNFKK